MAGARRTTAAVRASGAGERGEGGVGGDGGDVSIHGECGGAGGVEERPGRGAGGVGVGVGVGAGAGAGVVCSDDGVSHDLREGGGVCARDQGVQGRERGGGEEREAAAEGAQGDGAGAVVWANGSAPRSRTRCTQAATPPRSTGGGAGATPGAGVVVVLVVSSCASGGERAAEAGAASQARPRPVRRGAEAVEVCNTSKCVVAARWWRPRRAGCMWTHPPSFIASFILILILIPVITVCVSSAGDGVGLHGVGADHHGAGDEGDGTNARLRVDVDGLRDEELVAMGDKDMDNFTAVGAWSRAQVAVGVMSREAYFVRIQHADDGLVSAVDLPGGIGWRGNAC